MITIIKLHNYIIVLSIHYLSLAHRAMVHITLVLKSTMRVNGTKVKDVDGAGCSIATGRHMKGSGEMIRGTEKDSSD